MVNLVKLTNDSPKVSLVKDAGFLTGLMRVNLNWEQDGFDSVDLDLGCLFELQDGTKGAIQALGEAFGDLYEAPWIELDGDDRTGESEDGENIHINLDFISQIKRIMVYTFIYEGASDWEGADAVVTIYPPDAEPIEVRLDDTNSDFGMCGIAMIEVKKGRVSVTREVEYFKGHKQLDKHYGWGLQWTPGSK